MELEKTTGCCGILLTTDQCVEMGRGPKVRQLVRVSSCVPTLRILRIGLVTKELFEFDIIKVMTCPNCNNKECTVES